MKNKHSKYERKVFLVKYNDMRERIILSKTVRKRTKKAQSNERIAPCCLRPGCKSGFKYKEVSKQHKTKRRNHTPKVYKKITHKVSYTTKSSEKICLNSEYNNNLLYENISSDPLTSSYSDEDLENLMKSTRKRMRDSDEEWKLYLRKPYTSTPLTKTDNDFLQSLENINSSFDSLETLVLEADVKKNIPVFDMNWSPIMNPEKLVKQEQNEEKLKLDPLFLSQDLHYKDNIKKEYYESSIDKVIIKLEKNDNNMDLPKINNNNFSIKQELYGDL